MIIFMKIISLLLILISFHLLAKPSDRKNPERLYKKIFKTYASKLTHKTQDTISENPINTTVLEFKDKENRTVGFARELITTTGCNSACLPIKATLFYNAKKQFISVQSREGLTKKDHAAFSASDYQNLDLYLLQNPKVFRQVKNPKLMVDALTGETLKTYAPYVVKNAAYTTLRLNLYNQDTLSFLKRMQDFVRNEENPLN